MPDVATDYVSDGRVVGCFYGLCVDSRCAIRWRWASIVYILIVPLLVPLKGGGTRNVFVINSRDVLGNRCRSYDAY